jgi:prepilin-type processing-associated H-X9-DG protein
MPDAFASVVTLILLTLMFDPGVLGTVRRLVLIPIATIGIAVHTSHFGLAVGLVAAAGGGCWLLRRWWPELKPRLRMAGFAVAAAIPLVMGIHWATTGHAMLVQPSNVLWLDGSVQWFSIWRQ